MSNTLGQPKLLPFTLESLGLVDSDPEPAFDNLTALTRSLLDVQVSLVSIVQVEKDRQYFKSQQGLPEPWASKRETPLTHSFCQHVSSSGLPLIIENAHENSLVCDNLAIPELNVVAYMGVPIHDPNQIPIGALCIIDSKPRKWSEDALNSLQQISACVSDAIRLKAAVKTGESLRQEQKEFSYAVSHDLKAPSNTLQMIFNELSLLPELQDEDTSGLIELGMETLGRMRSQVDDVLRFAEVIGDELPAEKVDLAEVIREVLADLQGDIRDSDAQISVGEMPCLMGSRSHFHMLFLNLLSNAIKYCEPGKPPEVSISAITGRRYVRIEVEDKGIGIPKKYHDRIFQVFQRLHTRDEYPGTGLGLSLCRRIVNNHGGHIEVTSVPNESTRFTLRLPGVVE